MGLKTDMNNIFVIVRFDTTVETEVYYAQTLQEAREQQTLLNESGAEWRIYERVN
jgi:hypothetical protein